MDLNDKYKTRVKICDCMDTLAFYAKGKTTNAKVL